MDDLIWLTQWYASQCNDDWEHQYGIKLDTLDNPGWILKINLEETYLESRPFEPQRHNTESPEYDPIAKISWWDVRVENKTFRAACGPHDLPIIFSIFRKWGEMSARSN